MKIIKVKDVFAAIVQQAAYNYEQYCKTAYYTGARTDAPLPVFAIGRLTQSEYDLINMHCKKNTLRD